MAQLDALQLYLSRRGYHQGLIARLMLLTPDRVEKLIIGCDRKWRKWTIFFKVKDRRELDGLVSRLAPLPEKEQKNAPYQGYIFSGTPDDKRMSYLFRRDENEAVMIYPVHRHRGGADAGNGTALADVKNLLPRREMVLIWGAGLIREESYPLKGVSSFDLALEKNFSGKLTLHGRLVCRDESDAALLELFINTSLPFVLQYKYGIPPEESKRAGKSLNILRQGNILYFSAESVEPLMQIMLRVLNKRLPELTKVSDEKK
jgi:hypothetical protein